jgi:hypothetical protein
VLYLLVLQALVCFSGSFAAVATYMRAQTGDKVAFVQAGCRTAEDDKAMCVASQSAELDDYVRTAPHLSALTNLTMRKQFLDIATPVERAGLSSTRQGIAGRFTTLAAMEFWYSEEVSIFYDTASLNAHAMQGWIPPPAPPAAIVQPSAQAVTGNIGDCPERDLSTPAGVHDACDDVMNSGLLDEPLTNTPRIPELGILDRRSSLAYASQAHTALARAAHNLAAPLPRRMMPKFNLVQARLHFLINAAAAERIELLANDSASGAGLRRGREESAKCGFGSKGCVTSRTPSVLRDGVWLFCKRHRCGHRGHCEAALADGCLLHSSGGNAGAGVQAAGLAPARAKRRKLMSEVDEDADQAGVDPAVNPSVEALDAHVLGSAPIDGLS